MQAWLAGRSPAEVFQLKPSVLLTLVDQLERDTEEAQGKVHLKETRQCSKREHPVNDADCLDEQQGNAKNPGEHS